MTENTILNESLNKLHGSYLFAELKQKVRAFRENFPERTLVDLGIGDVTGPIAYCVVKALQSGVREQAFSSSFRGYGPENGYGFMRVAVKEYYLRDIGAEIDEDDIFVADGAKSAIDRIFGCFKGKVLLPEPCYPAYFECAAGRGLQPVAVRKSEEDGFVALPPGNNASPCLIVLCSPDNPTGASMPYEALRMWIDYARKTGSYILFDSAYERFVRSRAPRSIYCVEGARECCIETGSLSKSACFTGMRLGWTVIPEELDGGRIKKLYSRVLGCSYNGAPYIIQKAACAALSAEGIRQCGVYIDECLKNAGALKRQLMAAGASAFGGEDSPYVWLKCPEGYSGGGFADELLYKAGIAVTPGGGFGNGGENFVRLSALGGGDAASSAAKNIIALFRAAKR